MNLNFRLHYSDADRNLNAKYWANISLCFLNNRLSDIYHWLIFMQYVWNTAVVQSMDCLENTLNFKYKLVSMKTVRLTIEYTFVSASYSYIGKVGLDFQLYITTIMI